MVPGPAAAGDRGRQVPDRAEERVAGADRHPHPRPDAAERDGRRAGRDPAGRATRASRSPTSSRRSRRARSSTTPTTTRLMQKSKGLYGILQIDPKGFPADLRPRVLPGHRRAGRLLRHQRQGVPVHRADRGEAGRAGAHPPDQPRRDRPPDAQPRLPDQDRRHGRLPGAEAAQLTKDTVTIGPGERYDLEFVADNPGAWVYHCHILSHVQNKGVEPGGMISLVKISE